MTQEIVDRLLDRIQSVIFTTDPPILLFSGANQDPRGDLEKHSIFMPASKVEKVRKTGHGASKKHQNRSSDQQKTFFAKTLFLQYLPYEIPLKNQCKKWPGNKL